MTPRFRPRSTAAQLIRENLELRKKIKEQNFMSEAKDQAQREWVDKRIKEINTQIRESNKPWTPRK